MSIKTYLVDLKNRKVDMHNRNIANLLYILLVLGLFFTGFFIICAGKAKPRASGAQKTPTWRHA